MPNYNQYVIVFLNIKSYPIKANPSLKHKPGEGPAVYRAKEAPSFLHYFKTLNIGPVPEPNPRPPALQSSALPTELILLRLKTI